MTVNWSELPHAYGMASDIPPLLQAARTAPPPTQPDTEPWFSLWSALCHQGDVYWASYAALPELIAIAASRTDGVRGECILLAAGIELGRHAEFAPEMPGQLQAAYELALSEGLALTSTWSDPSSEIEERQWAIGAATFRGDRARAQSLLDDTDA